MQSVTSTEAGDFQASSSTEKNGRMKFVSVEEPPTRAATPENTISELGQDRRLSYVRMVFNAIKNTAHSSDDILRRCTKLTRKQCGESIDPSSDELAQSRNHLIGRLKTAVSMAIDIDRQKSDPHLGSNAEQLISAEDDLEKEKDAIFGMMWSIGQKQRDLNEISTRTSRDKDSINLEQPPKLSDLTVNQHTLVESLVNIIDQSKARSLVLLVKNHWSVDGAAAAYFDEEDDPFVNSDEEEVNNAVLASQNTMPKDGYFSTVPDKQPEAKSCAGPSGIEKLPVLSKEEEKAELDAARSRFAQLLRQHEDQHQDGGRKGEEKGDSTKARNMTPDDLARHIKGKPDLEAWKARIDAVQSNNVKWQNRRFSNPLEALFSEGRERVNLSPVVQDPDASYSTGAQGGAFDGWSAKAIRAPALQTAQDAVSRKLAQKRGSSEELGGSPSKKRRESDDSAANNALAVTAASITGDQSQIKLERYGIPSPDRPASSNAKPVSTSSTKITANSTEPLDDSDKIAILKSMSLGSEKRCFEALFENRGDLERTITVLQAESLPPRPPSQRFAPSQSPPTEATPIRTSLAFLKAMGFTDNERNEEMLKLCDNELDAAVEELQKPRSDDTSSGDSEEEKEKMSLGDEAADEHAKTMDGFESATPTYTGKGKGSMEAVLAPSTADRQYVGLNPEIMLSSIDELNQANDDKSEDGDKEVETFQEDIFVDERLADLQNEWLDERRQPVGHLGWEARLALKEGRKDSKLEDVVGRMGSVVRSWSRKASEVKAKWDREEEKDTKEGVVEERDEEALVEGEGSETKDKDDDDAEVNVDHKQS